MHEKLSKNNSEKGMKFSYDASLVTKDKIEELSQPLIPYMDTLNQTAKSGAYDTAESSINLPIDEKILQEVKELKDKKV